jgi:molybdopterin molybdotransferase
VGEPISIAEARRTVLEHARPLGSEELPLERLLRRVLAEDVTSELDVPPFDNSAMDGFAVLAGPGGELRIAGESRAGHPAAVTVQPGSAVRISTGAALPPGAEAVVPVERTRPAHGGVVVPGTAGGENVRRAGEDLRAGETVLRAGTRLGPAQIGVAASIGRVALRCARRPRVSVIATGDELTAPGKPLGPGRIYSSNEHTLTAQVARAGGDLLGHRIVPDDAGEILDALAGALRASEVVVVSGGVSVGAHDHVKSSLAELGVKERFWGVALRPGKPTWFGTRQRVLVFGLPGNPVSTMVTFQLFARPALLALQGADPAPRRAGAGLATAVRRLPGREQALRVSLEESENGLLARATGGQGSHRLTSMLDADALALIPAGQGELPAGARVRLELL